MKKCINIKRIVFWVVSFQSFLTVLIIILNISTPKVYSQVPISTYQGISDPHIRVFNDTVFLYSGHDSSPDDKTWVMKDWRIFYTTDLLNWHLKGTISPKNNYMENTTSDCWAGDAATMNGKYYFYFSDRKRGIGVMTSNSPTGPFNDALGKPLVEPMHDPTILIDDTPYIIPYLIYGDKEGGGYCIARLNNDMVSLIENPKPIKINGNEWEKAPIWMDKNYLFKYNNTYYLTWGRDYAISENIYGPYECTGTVGEGHHLNEFAHGSFFWWKGQFYHIWCYYVRPGYKYRDVILTYCHFDDNGKIVTDTGFLDMHASSGVANYNASWPKIEAEWYYEKSEEIVKKGNKEDGFTISGMKNGSCLKYTKFNFENNPRFFKAKVKVLHGSGELEIREDDSSGNLLGKIEIPYSENQIDFFEISGDLKKISGKTDILLRFTGSAESTMEIDWFKFSN